MFVRGTGWNTQCRYKIWMLDKGAKRQCKETRYFWKSDTEGKYTITRTCGGNHVCPKFLLFNLLKMPFTTFPCPPKKNISPCESKTRNPHLNTVYR